MQFEELFVLKLCLLLKLQPTTGADGFGSRAFLAYDAIIEAVLCVIVPSCLAEHAS
jgi:hypothetical protein